MLKLTLANLCNLSSWSQDNTTDNDGDLVFCSTEEVDHGILLTTKVVDLGILRTWLTTY